MNIIYHTIELINSEPLLGVSEEIEIFKGKNKIKNFKEYKINFIRKMFLIKNKIYNGRR